MKNRKFLLSALAVFTLAIVGCNNNDSTETKNTEKGSLGISMSFEKAPGVLAASSTAIPTTSWKSIKSMILVLTEGSGAAEMISDARALTVPTDAASAKKVFEGVAVGTYNVYIIANTLQDANTGFYGGAIVNKGLAADAYWSAGNLRGKKMSDLKYALMSLGVLVDGEKGGAQAGGLNYNSPQEIFVGKSRNAVSITAGGDVSTTVELTRIVSLVRVRVNVGTTDNKSVTFAVDEACLALSRVQMGASITGVLASETVNDKDYIYKKSQFSSDEPTTGYDGGVMLTGTDYDFWKETIMFPTTNLATPATEAAPASQKIFVKLSARVPAGYVFRDGTVAPAATVAYWGANADVWFHANQITEINCTLNSSGEGEGDKIVPKDEGNLTITVSYADWNGNIQEDNIEM